MPSPPFSGSTLVILQRCISKYHHDVAYKDTELVDGFLHSINDVGYVFPFTCQCKGFGAGPLEVDE